MDDNDSKVIPFAERAAGMRESEAGEAAAPGDAYAVVAGQRQALALRLIHRDGRSLSLPYAHRPLIWYQSPELIILEYLGLFSVPLRGFGLAALADRLAEFKVTRIRELDPLHASGLVTAVTSIEIIRSFPSRDVGDA